MFDAVPPRLWNSLPHYNRSAPITDNLKIGLTSFFPLWPVGLHDMPVNALLRVCVLYCICDFVVALVWSIQSFYISLQLFLLFGLAH